MPNHHSPHKTTVDARPKLVMRPETSHCFSPHSYTSSLDISVILLGIFGCLANLTVTRLLFLLRCKKSEGLSLLRALSCGCLACALICLIEKVCGLNPNTGNVYIDGLICILWSSRFLFWFTYFQICHSIFYFACNRASVMLQINNYPITTEKQRLTAYMLLVFIGSFIGAVPPFLLTLPPKKGCTCAPLPENFIVLTVLYAHVFLWVAIIGVIYPTTLVYICTALILRLRKSERGASADELEELYFPISTTTTIPSPSLASSSSSGDSERSRTKRLGNTSVPHVWSASFCIVPLTAAFIVGTAFESVQQFLSAAGLLIYKLRSPAEQFSVTLISLMNALVPLILFFHIPAMRSLIFVAIASIKTKIGKIESTDIGDLPRPGFSLPMESIANPLDG